MNWKRIALVIGFILVIIFFAFLIYYFFFRIAPLPPQTKLPPEGPIQNFPPGSIAQPPSGKAKSIPPIVSEEKNITPPQEALPQTAKEAQGGPVTTHELDTSRNSFVQKSSDGSSISTYDVYEKKFFQISPDGQKTALSNQLFPGVAAVQWGPKSQKAVLSFYDSTQILYDFKQQKQLATLPPHWQNINFSPTGEKIAFKSIGDYEENKWIAVAQDDGSNAQLIEPLGKKAGLFDVNWSPAGHIVATFHEGIDQDRQKLYFVGLNKENFQDTIIEGRGYEGVWSPAGDRLLYSVYSSQSDYKPELWIVDAYGDAIGQNRRRLKVQTWVDKCTFTDNTTAYCAVPKELIQGAAINRPLGDTGEDVLYKINTATGEKTKLAEPSQKHTIEKVIVSQDESKLFFTDKDSGKLYEINLK